MGELLRLAEPVDRDLLEQRLSLLFGELFGHHGRLDVGGRYSVHGDPERSEFCRQTEG